MSSIDEAAGENQAEVRPWKATLDTDLMEFCTKEGIRHGGNNSSETIIAINLMLSGMYNRNIAKTVGDLVNMTKYEFMRYRKYAHNGRKASDEQVWSSMNYRLKKHGYRMYTRAKAITENDL